MKKFFTLPVVDRRCVLQGIGAATVVALLPACGQTGSDLPTAATTTCSGGLCIDVTAAGNTALATPGGALLIDTSTDTIMVIRASDTSVIALSAICTHAGCSLNFDAGASQLTCPCHGSVFNESGAVVNGPARRALKVYQASVSGTTITVAA